MPSPIINLLSDDVIYTNELTPLKADSVSVNGLSRDKIVWNFGDGSKSESLTANHVYDIPGIYTLSLTQYLSSGLPVTSTLNITAFDLIPNSIEWLNNSNTWNYDNVFQSQKTSAFFEFIVFNSPKFSNDTILVDLYSRNSNSIPYSDIYDDIQLLPTWEFYDVNDNIINTLELSTTKLYGYYNSSNEIEITSKKLSSSVFIGTSSYGQFKYKDDIPKFDGLITLSITPRIFEANQVKFNDFSLINTKTLYKSLSVLVTTPTSLRITNDGLFTLSGIRYERTKIPYLIYISGSNGEFLKNIPVPNLDSYPLSVSFSDNVLLSSNSLTSFELSTYELSSNRYSGYVEGFFIPLSNYEDLNIEARTRVTYKNQNGLLTTLTLTGNTEIDVLDQNSIYFAKINENFDAKDTYKNYRTVPILYEFDTFFNDYLGGIVGDINSDGNSLGKTVYEKIANFVNNNVDVFESNVDSLNSMLELIGEEENVENFDYPPSLKRLVNLFSINQKKLFGENIIKLDDLEKYKGEKIDFTTYKVSAFPQVKFIAQEKFNDYHTLIEPLYIDDSKSPTYDLSAYNNSWGWGLSYPANESVSIYYNFYTIEYPDVTKIYSVINWYDILTTSTLSSLSSYTDYTDNNNIIDKVILEQLLDGLNLFV